MNLTGEHIRLRPLAESDLDRRREMTNDPELQLLTIGWETGERSQEELRSWFKALSEDDHSVQLAIDTLDGDTYIGDVDIHGINPFQKETWVEPFFGDWDHRTTEYIQDTLRTAGRHAFDELEMEKVMVEVLDKDTLVVSVLTELGFEQVESIDNMNETHSLIFELKKDE